MIIRKLFKYECAHIVRNCSSSRCRKSLHGHSFTVEVLLKSNTLDNAYMVYDFGLMKGTIKDFIDSFDHAYAMWEKEETEFKSFIKSNSARWIELPFSPSAESFAVFFHYCIKKILLNTTTNNGEGDITVHAVRVHETDTGYAESQVEDLALVHFSLDDIVFSSQIQSEWSNPSMWEDLKANRSFINPKIEITHGVPL